MEIITTADGSHSLRHDLLGELYHSDRGAIGEAMHVYIDNGFRHVVDSKIEKMSIFEVGFGSGLNAWLTMREALEKGITVDYHAIELYPVDIHTVAHLNFTGDPSFMALHTAPWNRTICVSDYFSLTKHNYDLDQFNFSTINAELNLVYHDAFSPEIQPDLWSVEIFRRMQVAMTLKGVLVTYSAKGTVKEALREAGFAIERLPGALGKRHMIRATKP